MSPSRLATSPPPPYPPSPRIGWPSGQVDPDLVRASRSGAGPRPASAPSNRSCTSTSVAACLPVVAAPRYGPAAAPAAPSITERSWGGRPRDQGQVASGPPRAGETSAEGRHGPPRPSPRACRPDVPASRRCTIPGRSGSSPGASGTPSPSSRLTRVPSRRDAVGWTTMSGRLRQHQQVLVLEPDGERPRLEGRPPARPGRPRPTRRPPAGTTSARDDAVDPHAAGGDRSLCVGRGDPQALATTASSRPGLGHERDWSRFPRGLPVAGSARCSAAEEPADTTMITPRSRRTSPRC